MINNLEIESNKFEILKKELLNKINSLNHKILSQNFK